MPHDTARRDALARLLADWEAGRPVSGAALTKDDDMMIERLIMRGELTWLEDGWWVPTRAGLAAARAAGEAKDG